MELHLNACFLLQPYVSCFKLITAYSAYVKTTRLNCVLNAPDNNDPQTANDLKRMSRKEENSSLMFCSVNECSVHFSLTLLFHTYLPQLSPELENTNLALAYVGQGGRGGRTRVGGDEDVRLEDYKCLHDASLMGIVHQRGE